MKIITLLLIVILHNSYCGQTLNLKSKVDNLKNVKEMPYIPELSGDSLFWTVVVERLDIMPYLIQKLDDTTLTNIEVPNFGGHYTVADIANTAIIEIIKNVPILEIIEENNVSIGFGSYWHYTRKSINNRKKYKQRLAEWYEKNNANLVWIEDNNIYKTSENWKFSNKHPAGGFYRFQK